ncbi:hypothetical protein ACS0TY_006818 [Phlomoides rotata]
MSRLSEELCNIFGDDFDEHSLSEDDGSSNAFKTAQNETVPSNDVDTQAQGTQSNHTKNEGYELVPSMSFLSLDSLSETYQEHTRCKGISVDKRTSKKAVERDEYKYARMVFDKSGSSRANKSSKRVGCRTRLNVIRHVNGSWIISKMMTEHNHEIDPTFSPLMPTHMNVNVHMKRILEANNIVVVFQETVGILLIKEGD